MYAIKTQDGRYYNGRASNGWNGNLTNDKAEAFQYGEAAAKFKVDTFNAYSKLHGFVFEVEAV